MSKPTPPRRAPEPGQPPRRRRRHPLRRAAPLIFFGVIALLILRDRFPVIDDTWRGWLQPQAQQAIALCRQQALASARHPEFARLRRWGSVEKTPGGYVVKNVVLVEMDEDGGERRVRVLCHVDGAGRLVKLHRELSLPPAAPQGIVDGGSATD